MSENNQLYSFGENEEGQLGLGHTKSVTSPELVHVPVVASNPDSPLPSALKVACGTRHTAALFGEEALVYLHTRQFMALHMHC